MTERAGQFVELIRRTAARLPAVKVMEVCGTHTVSLFRSGVRSLLPGNVQMLSGPGCPVCVTAQGYIDAACRIAAMPDVVVCTYGDMIRVPGQGGSLESQRARGAQIKVVYSARDAVRFAAQHAEKKVVFLAVGFETTAPATAAAVLEADRLGLENFSILCAHKLVVPAMEALLEAGDVPIDGFLCPGHVSVIIGADAYRPVAEKHGRPCVVAGFEPPQMFEGIARLLEQIAGGRAVVENAYPVAVSAEGNAVAKKLIAEAFVTVNARWRGIGTLPSSGQELSPEYERFDARRRFNIEMDDDRDPAGCVCGDVIQGRLQPDACTLFGSTCTPHHPVGPCMVSSEGTCAAWYKYNRPTASRTGGR